MRVFGAECISESARKAETAREAMIVAVWARIRAAYPKVGPPGRSLCGTCNAIRACARRGLVEFESMAEVAATGCDSDEFRPYWPTLSEPAPTAARPGSREKLKQLAARIMHGEELFHGDDFVCRDDLDNEE